MKCMYSVCACVCVFGAVTPGNQSGQTNIWMSWPSLAEPAFQCDIRTKHSPGYKFSMLGEKKQTIWPPASC